MFVVFSGGKTFHEHRQVVGEDHDARPRGDQRGAVLCWRRDPWPVVASSARAIGSLSEVSHWVGVAAFILLLLVLTNTRA